MHDGYQIFSSSDESVFPPLHCLIVAGKDRASFLHNFCTNNINELPAGRWCEAFFTDVKARILGHGLVAAGTDCIAIVTVGGDIDRLEGHLSRYIITEDVTITRFDGSSVALCGSAVVHLEVAADECQVGATEVILHATWNDCSVGFRFCSAAALAEFETQLKSKGANTIGAESFEHLRVAEGYPVVGIDVTDQNMAPEAARTKQAISYTKGCYLGQEPIARLDAMGHVNRQLYRGTAEFTDAKTTDLPQVTSHSPAVKSNIPVLAVLKVADVKPQMVLRLSDDQAADVAVTLD